MLKKLSIIVFFVFILGIITGQVSNYINSFRTVKVNIGSGVQVYIYKDLLKNGAHTFDMSKPVFKLQTSSSLKMRYGIYDFVIQKSSQSYKNPVQRFTVSHDTKSINYDPFFSVQHLSTLLNSERSTIQNSIVNLYPNISSYYTFGSDKLYEYGNWYGVVLNPTNSSLDTLKVIMRHKGNSWILATQPQISISAPSNPTIPWDVINETDSL